MPGLGKPLSALEVKRLSEPGMRAVGTVAQLGLVVKPTGARSQVMRTMVGARRAEIGLGGFPTVTRAQAHEAARDLLQRIKTGVEPASGRRTRRSTAHWMFQRCAEV